MVFQAVAKMCLHLFSQIIPNMQEVCLKNAPENPQSSRGHTTIKVWYANLKQKTLVLLDRSAEEHILRRLSFSVPGHLIITLHQLIDVTAQGAWKVWAWGDKGYLNYWSQEGSYGTYVYLCDTTTTTPKYRLSSSILVLKRLYFTMFCLIRMPLVSPCILCHVPRDAEA
jgi:hypothetical protein